MTVRPFHVETPTVLDELVRTASSGWAALARRTGIALVAALRGISVPEDLIGTLARRETVGRLLALVGGIDGLRGDLPGWLEANGIALAEEVGLGRFLRG